MEEHFMQQEAPKKQKNHSQFKLYVYITQKTQENVVMNKKYSINNKSKNI